MNVTLYIYILMHCILIFSILVPIPHGRHVAVRRQSATRLPRRLRPTPRPPRRPGQGCLWLGNQSVEVPVSVSVKIFFVELYAMWYVFYVYIYIMYIYIYRLKYSICWSVLKYMIVNPEVQLGGFLRMRVASGIWGDGHPLGREPAGRRAQYANSIVLSEFTAYPKTLWTTDGIHWALVATWCPHRACASPYKGHPTLSSYKARA